MFKYPTEYDVVVVGGGHAGVEASLASARMGCKTLLLTSNPDTIAQMSCNPAIGGLAKGHLVREIDALGGEMGKATDMCGIHFRLLNTRKGPAVQAPRAQCDKKAYQFHLKWICERQPNLDIKLGQVASLQFESGRCRGVETELGVIFRSKSTVLTTGTFLRGLMHVGLAQSEGGRAGEKPANNLTASLMALGLQIGRFKTGTPPRLLRRSIDFSKMETQAGDSEIQFFSFWRDLFHVEHASSFGSDQIVEANRPPPGSVLEKNGGQVNCYLTHTTNSTAEIVKDSLHLSPLYGGIIEGIGPRYCPSIEDKFVRFPEKQTHQLFLEPEGLFTDEVYVNGLSTSLPFEVQYKLVRSIVGCEHAEIVRPAYAVEYDYVFPTQLQPSLEAKCCQGLFLAGQINGTSGYEEAAAQGLMAGVNAARSANGMDPVILSRDQAYIGVLIDDLVSKGTQEPYRMFTSRAEHRLLLRHDNADLRLAGIGADIGLLTDSSHQAVVKKRTMIRAELDRLASTRFNNATQLQLLRRPELSYYDLPDPDHRLPREIVKQVEIATKYEGYIERQHSEIERVKKLDDNPIPPSFDYTRINGLRIEAKQKLAQIRPATVGQASRISGVSPADIGILLVWLRKSHSTEITAC